ncbi:uncharacterized protein LOC129893622 [Solanum dulcamara]|uniref:uncharacterized protein LOC129893622 n=1 Tax=Solanum dulcamara TaxID=45834 RepID=UPI0024857314|nr:uncharacterized protein LOC129893622 [Solanum dulcamara]
MTEFDMIIGMDWLSFYYANIDCQWKVVHFQFPGELVIEWAEAPTLQSVPVVNEFSNIFPYELPGLPPEWEIDFIVDELPNTHPISIPPYRIAPADLKELKEKLKDLLEKGFIRPRSSPWGALSDVFWADECSSGIYGPDELGIQTIPGYVDTQKIEAIKNWPRPTTPIEANVVADALSRKSLGILADVPPEKKEIVREIGQLASLGVRLAESRDNCVSVRKVAESSIIEEIKQLQYKDPVLAWYRNTGIDKEKTPFGIISDGVLLYRNRLCVPDVAGLHQQVMEFMAQCPNCEQVKIEHQKPGLPRTPRKYDSIWVIVDRLTKSARFLLIRITYSTEDYARLYIKEIVKLHGVHVSVITDRGAQFTPNFWRSFQAGLWTQSVMRFGRKGKLSPRYIGSYQIVRKVGKVAYELDLPADLDAVHPVFHVSMLRKFVGDPSRVFTVQDIQVSEELSYDEQQWLF